jgi:hypothetical protein
MGTVANGIWHAALERRLWVEISYSALASECPHLADIVEKFGK